MPGGSHGMGGSPLLGALGDSDECRGLFGAGEGDEEEPGLSFPMKPRQFTSISIQRTEVSISPGASPPALRCHRSVPARGWGHS